MGVGLEALGTVQLEAGRPDEAVATLRRALTIQEAAFGADEPRPARCRARLALALVESGRAGEAAVLAERSVREMEPAVGARPEELPPVRGLAWGLLARARAAESDAVRGDSYRRLARLLDDREGLRQVVELQALYREAVTGGRPPSHH